MIPAWKQYQDDSAAVFRKMGLQAETDKIVEGVRGTHAVDVYVSGTLGGLQVRWVVECKAWKSNVPKEKVLALLSIVQDIGTDKGILLSEVGFQPGAVRSARNTNIILTSIADLGELIEADFKESVLAKFSWRLSRVTERLRALDAGAEDYVWTPQLGQQLRLFVLDLAFQDALRGSFPVVYAISQGEERLKAHDFSDLVAKAGELLRSAEEHCTREEGKAIKPFG